MPQIVADRFVRSGTAWIDLATGEAVRLRLAPAGSASAQMAWNGRCAQLANLRHPLINPLIDYGMAGAGRIFEAYAAYGPVRERGTRAESLLSHAACFLEAHEVALTRPLADFVLRPISIGSSGTARGTPFDSAHARPLAPLRARRTPDSPARHRLCNAAVCSTHRRRARRGPAGRRVPGVDCGGAGLGSAHVPAAGRADGTASGIRADCAGRPADHPWVADHLLARHVCVIGGETCGTAQDAAIASVLTRLSAASPRRHVVLSFGRPLDRADAAHVRMDPMGITAMTGMVFVDPGGGPSPDDLFDAARRADGRPGRFLAELGAYVEEPARSATMAVHETAQPYVVGPAAGSKLRAEERSGRTAALLRRAAGRGEALARTGRHASAARVLTRAVRVLSHSGGHADAARCGILLGWLALDRGRTAEAAQSFETAREVCPDGVRERDGGHRARALPGPTMAGSSMRKRRCGRRCWRPERLAIAR